jgi:acyl-CoA synthetase (AMP-forming)/AMP-acid ligase II
VGEIWVTSPALPKSFWNMPDISDQFLRAHGTLLSSPPLDPITLKTPLRSDPLFASKFARTGLYGFIIDESMVLEATTPRLFSLGLCNDAIWQKFTATEHSEILKTPPVVGKWLISRELAFYMGPLLAEMVMTTVQGVDSWYVL